MQTRARVSSGQAPVQTLQQRVPAQHGSEHRMDSEDAELANQPRCGVSELPPADTPDPVVEVYKKDVDRTLLIRNLRLTPAERAEKLVDFVSFLTEIRRAGQRLRSRDGH